MASLPTAESERAALQAQLVAKYGEQLFNRACDFSNLRLLMVALATDEMTPAERKDAFEHATTHLSALIASLMGRVEMAKLIACAERIDSAVDVWVADDIEARDGLPLQGATK